jgi:hypothetical protein
VYLQVVIEIGPNETRNAKPKANGTGINGVSAWKRHRGPVSVMARGLRVAIVICGFLEKMPELV